MIVLNEPLVSIIMPVYNARDFIEEAIQSVIRQGYDNWELIIVNDGSTDGSNDILTKFDSYTRIHIYNQSNKGVSSARNVGLAKMKGDYFCFLDADDTLPPNSIESRLKVFQANPALSFVDGSVAFIDSISQKQTKQYRPQFEGPPLRQLLKLSDTCFFGLSWMIKQSDCRIFMREDIKHGEDLLFFMELSRNGGLYLFTNELVLNYRQHERSAMRDLVALEKGYWDVFNIIKDWKEFNSILRIQYQYKVKKFMFLDYLKIGDYLRALKVLVK
jgi:teichuronic acid biosynthesis glycosyltransferase TuaG